MHMLGEPRTMQRRARATRTSSTRSRRSSRSASRSRCARASPSERDHARPGHRLRQDDRAQPRAAARASDELTRARPPAGVGTSRKSFLGRIIARRGRRGRARRARPAAARDDRHERARARARARACSASTTSAPVRDALAVAAATLGGRWTARSGDDDADELEDDGDDLEARIASRAPSRSRSRSPASRCTPTTASARPSARSASGW